MKNKKERVKETSKANIMFVFFNLGIGGIQRKIVDICRYVASHKEFSNINIHIILRDKTKFNLCHDIQYKNIYIHFRPAWLNEKLHIFFPVYIFWKMVRIKPVSVLSFLVMSSAYSIAASKFLFWLKVPVIINEDTLTSKKVDSKFKQQLIRFFYPHSYKIISPTLVSKKDLIGNFAIDSKKIVVLPNWTIAHKRPVRKIPKYDLIFAGRFTKQKNLMFLVNAIRKIKTHYPNIKAVLVGEGEDEVIIQNFIRDNHLKDNIEIIPTSHDLKELLLSSKIFTLTSEYEGMSVVLLEAMALKTPVIVTKYPGVEEYLTHMKTAYIESNLEEYSQRIVALLKDEKERKRIAENAYLSIEEKYSQKTIKKYLNLLVND